MAPAYTMGNARLADFVLTRKGASAVHAGRRIGCHHLFICCAARASEKLILMINSNGRPRLTTHSTGARTALISFARLACFGGSPRRLIRALDAALLARTSIS
jgi:hypothetical protein